MTSSIFLARNVPKRGAPTRAEQHVKVDPNSNSSSVLSTGLVDQSGFKKDQLADYFTFDGLLMLHGTRKRKIVLVNFVIFKLSYGKKDPHSKKLGTRQQSA
ncbi:hypothetical protein BpHYR1_014355 [Brachionus plicatilis]|uniref:Uncharacterized protein n=1 Tax=Brachionus plicatilis TaxID=10195 RepID=A0A3M7PYQ8_BRAPC|nr:hypothetical protein BpHYR1_014355 [Brachionus plicatilis]